MLIPPPSPSLARQRTLEDEEEQERERRRRHRNLSSTTDDEPPKPTQNGAQRSVERYLVGLGSEHHFIVLGGSGVLAVPGRLCEISLTC